MFFSQPEEIEALKKHQALHHLLQKLQKKTTKYQKYSESFALQTVFLMIKNLAEQIKSIPSFKKNFQAFASQTINFYNILEKYNALFKKIDAEIILKSLTCQDINDIILKTVSEIVQSLQSSIGISYADEEKENGYEKFLNF